MTKKLII